MPWAAPAATLGLLRGLLCSGVSCFSVIKPHGSYKTHGEQQPEYPTSSGREGPSSKLMREHFFPGRLQKDLDPTQARVGSGHLVPGLAHLGRSQFDKFQEPSSRHRTSAKQESFIPVLPRPRRGGFPCLPAFLRPLAHGEMHSHQRSSAADVTKNPPSGSTARQLGNTAPEFIHLPSHDTFPPPTLILLKITED